MNAFCLNEPPLVPCHLYWIKSKKSNEFIFQSNLLIVEKNIRSHYTEISTPPPHSYSLHPLLNPLHTVQQLMKQNTQTLFIYNTVQSTKTLLVPLFYSNYRLAWFSGYKNPFRLLGILIFLTLAERFVTSHPDIWINPVFFAKGKSLLQFALLSFLFCKFLFSLLFKS